MDLARLRRTRRPQAAEWWFLVATAAMAFFLALAPIYDSYERGRLALDATYIGNDLDHFEIEVVNAPGYFDEDQQAVWEAAPDRPFPTPEELDAALTVAEQTGTRTRFVVEYNALISANGESWEALDAPLGNDKLVAIRGSFVDELDLVRSGRLPTTSGEIALSNDVAKALGVAAGDTVTLTHPEGVDSIDMTVVGTIRSPREIAFFGDVSMFARSSSYSAVVSWDDAFGMYPALKSERNRPLVFGGWDGDLPALTAVFGDEVSERDTHDYDNLSTGDLRFDPGLRVVAFSAAFIALLALPRRFSRPSGLAGYARVAASAVAGALAGIVLAGVVAAAIHAGVDLAYPDLVQPAFARLSAGEFGTVLWQASADGLGLAVLWLIGGLRWWRARWLSAPARWLRPAVWRRTGLAITAVAFAALLISPWIADREQPLSLNNVAYALATSAVITIAATLAASVFVPRELPAPGMVPAVGVAATVGGLYIVGFTENAASLWDVSNSGIFSSVASVSLNGTVLVVSAVAFGFVGALVNLRASTPGPRAGLWSAPARALGVFATTALVALLIAASVGSAQNYFTNDWLSDALNTIAGGNAESGFWGVSGLVWTLRWALSSLAVTATGFLFGSLAASAAERKKRDAPTLV